MTDTAPTGTQPAQRDSQRRELGLTLALAVLGAGGILLAAGRSWVGVGIERQPPFGPVQATLTGRTIYPALTGLAVVALLVAALTLVTGGLVRRSLGLLLMLTGGWTAWYGLRGPGRLSAHRMRELLGGQLNEAVGPAALHSHRSWAALTVLCSVLLVLAGLVLLVRGGRWKPGLSTRYAAPAEAAKSDDPWRSLDRGEDPTVRDG